MIRIHQKILEQYKNNEQDLIQLLSSLQRKDLYKRLNCSQKVVDILIKHFNIKRNVAETHPHKWRKILNSYMDKAELINLLENTPYTILAKQWNCAVYCIYTLRKKLGIDTKRTDVGQFLRKYSKEQLEDLYLDKYNRHLKEMADGLDIYYDTLSKIFKQLGIEQNPHHMSEYLNVRENLRKQAKERAKIKNPINNIFNNPDWISNMVKTRTKNGSYTSPEYRAKLSKKHVEVLERGNHKFKNTDIELLLQAEFKKLNIPFILDKGLIDITVPDLFIKPNIAVYADGDYWHSLPKAKVKDPYINEGLRRAGYKVFRFLGSEIKSDVSKCVQQVVDYINSSK